LAGKDRRAKEGLRVDPWGGLSRTPFINVPATCCWARCRPFWPLSGHLYPRWPS